MFNFNFQFMITGGIGLSAKNVSTCSVSPSLSKRKSLTTILNNINNSINDNGFVDCNVHAVFLHWIPIFHRNYRPVVSWCQRRSK